MRKTIKWLLGPIVQKIHAGYLKKPRRYTYNDISVWVEPGVFPPFLTLSTKILLDFIDPMPLEGKRFLELGCGCGIISILAAKKNAAVTAIDINRVALNALEKNSADNNVRLTIIHSDLFRNLKDQKFDYIVINPPYYPKSPRSDADHAWFCGENFGYFRKLFAQLPLFMANDNQVYMILSQDCEIETIKSMAAKNNIVFVLALEQKKVGETNYIFKLSSL
jgi:release factor glutamine methyltransferase